MKLSLCLKTAFVLPLFLVNSASAATILANSADGEVSGGVVGALANTTVAGGGFWTGTGITSVIPFQLPTLAPGETFANATITLRYVQYTTGVTTTGAAQGLGTLGSTSSSQSAGPQFEMDVRGLTTVRDAATILTTDGTAGSALLHDGLITNATPSSTSVTTGDVTTWLNTLYDNGTNAGKFVFITLSQGDGTSSTLYKSVYQIGSANQGLDANKPTINYTVVPEPSASFLALISGMAALAPRRRKSGSR